MTDYCTLCLYEDYDGAEEPCINCLRAKDKKPTEYFPKRKPITNGDRIRAMSDEEMAGLFGVWSADCENNDVPCRKYCADYKSCGDTWLAWLRDEVSE